MKLISKLVVAGVFLAAVPGVFASDSGGYVEPGYVNYNYEISSSELSIRDINTLNQLEPSAAASDSQYEAGYRNYSYAARPAINPAAPFDEKSFRPFYSNYK